MSKFYDLINYNSKKIQFNIKNVDLSIVNSIRRIILAEIPNIAFKFDQYNIENNDIKIKINKGVLHNEFISHRLSLIPICFDENDLYNFKPENYKFILKLKNDTISTINVTSKNIEIFDSNNKKYPQNFHDKVFPYNNITKDYILITKLKPNLYDSENGDEVYIESYASIDIAKTHSRWCPVSQCCFYNQIDNEKADKILAKKINDKKLTSSEIELIKSKFNTLEIYRYYKKNKFDEPNEFVFLIESECNLRPNYIFFKSLIILNSKFNSFIYKLTEKLININNIGNNNNFYQLEIKDEDHTLLNIIQCLIYNQYFHNDNNKNILDYIGYYQPHPLDNLMYIKIKFNSNINTDIEYVNNLFINSIKIIINEIHDIIKEWITFSKLDKTDIIEVQNYLNSDEN